MPTLSASEQTLVTNALSSSQKLRSSTIGKLYMGNDGAWGYTGILGALVVLSDEAKKAHYLKIIDLKSGSPVWEQELYENFQYFAPVPFFHHFETDDYVAGFSFADEAEAKAFYAQVLYCKNTPLNKVESKPATPAPTPAASSPAPTPAPAPASSPSSSSSSSKTEKKPEKKKKGFFTKLKEKIMGESDPAANFELSGPRNFRHESHIGWDPERGFEIRNIPPQWKQLFQAAGVKKSELRDAETAKYVMNVISDALAAPSAPQPQEGAAATSAAAPPPPPPPPPASGGAPPPPPPPPPPGGAPGGASSGAPSGGSSAPPATDARADLLASIRAGTTLRKVEDTPKAGGMPDISNLDANQTKSLADTLALAMAARRSDLAGDDNADDDDDDWSD